MSIQQNPFRKISLKRIKLFLIIKLHIRTKRTKRMENFLDIEADFIQKMFKIKITFNTVLRLLLLRNRGVRFLKYNINDINESCLN